MKVQGSKQGSNISLFCSDVRGFTALRAAYANILCALYVMPLCHDLSGGYRADMGGGGSDGMERAPHALGIPKFPSSASNVQPSRPTLSEQRA